MGKIFSVPADFNHPCDRCFLDIDHDRDVNREGLVLFEEVVGGPQEP